MDRQGKTLGDRMKAYEAAFDTVLPPRQPILLRADGIGFSRWTRDCEKPFDPAFNEAMDTVARDLCEYVQDARLGYVQSDEVTLLVNPYRTRVSEPWRGGRLQKIVTAVAARAASVMTRESMKIFGEQRNCEFDCRAWVMPRVDVANAFVWRQQDAERNTVQALARYAFGHRQIHGLSTLQMRNKLREAGDPWEELAPGTRSGRIVRRFDRNPGNLEKFRPGWGLVAAHDVRWQDLVSPLVEEEPE